MDTEYKEMPTAAETDATVSAPSPASPVPVGEAESPKKKVPRWIWLALSIFLLAAAAVIFFVGIESSGDSDDYLAELNYANGGLVAYDSEHVYYLAPAETGSKKSEYILVYEADPYGNDPHVVCKEKALETIRSAESELYCFGKQGSDNTPFLARINKATGDLTVLRSFPAGTDITYFTVRDSELFYCANSTLYKGALEEAEPTADVALLNGCAAVHFSGDAVYYSSENEVFVYKLRSGKVRSLCSAAATQICRKGDQLFFMNQEVLLNVSSKGGEATKLVAHDSSETSFFSFFSLYKDNILYGYGFDADEVGELIDAHTGTSYSDQIYAPILKIILLFNGNVEYIGENGSEPTGTERPICAIPDYAVFSPYGIASGFYITPYQSYYSRNLVLYTLVEIMEFK